MGLPPIAIVIGLLIFQVDHMGYTGSQVYGVVCKVREAREASTHLGAPSPTGHHRFARFGIAFGVNPVSLSAGHDPNTVENTKVVKRFRA